jgi:2-oxoacid:acceptor oxidoreductase gamma subunit (pyruvate/2-ketoisovalerate family)/2-oxoacid:acceptor oxidoreductase delta subunit (pyruvate/2-ketoisovalerate family)
MLPPSAWRDDWGVSTNKSGATAVKEMVISGRGGQGVVLASQLLADALGRAGYWVQSFPEFKAERRGAPISAFLRWDRKSAIHRRYKVRECDVLAVVSASPPSPELIRSVRKGGLLVLNRDARFALAGKLEVVRVPASGIARRHRILSAEGRPMANVAVLGACMRYLVPGGLKFLEQAIAERVGPLAQANILAAREGYTRCTRQRRLTQDPRVEAAPPPAIAAARTHEIFPVSTIDSLQNHTGSWSDERPVLTETCTACALCALFCPEGAIARCNDSMTVDVLYCKGCGICEAVCPVGGAIAMHEVSE